MLEIEKLNFDKLNGLIPAIVVDIQTEQVLMLGFMDITALQKTLDTGFVTFFSRTKNRLWMKGETSGNHLKVIEVKSDCDNDSLLVYASPEGPTCHTGDYSCFKLEKKNTVDFLQTLYSIILSRKELLPDNSYTTKLFLSGENRIIQKVGEEAIETVIAAKNRNKDELINEVSDLFYHLFVMLAEQEISLTDIVLNLEKRHNK